MYVYIVKKIALPDGSVTFILKKLVRNSRTQNHVNLIHNPNIHVLHVWQHK